MIARLFAGVLAVLLSSLQLATGLAAAQGLPERFGMGPRPAPPQTLETLAVHIKAEPAVSGQSILAAEATDDGHWRLVNASGEPFTASGPLELTRALATLTLEAGEQPALLVVYLADDTVFRLPAMIPQLPGKASLKMLVGGKPVSLKVRGQGAMQTILAEVAPRQHVEISSRKLFEEAVRQLHRPIERARLRTLALQPGGPTVIPAAPRPDPTTRRALPDSIDPGHLASALTNLSGQIVIVFGRIEAGQLLYTPATGPEGRIAVSAIEAAAQAADVNLLVLGSTSTRQPGSRNWLWQRVELSYLDRATERQTLGEFLDTLAGEPPMLLIRAAAMSSDRTGLRLRPARDQGQGTSDNATDVIAGTWKDIVSETAGKVTVTDVTASMLSVTRQAELDRRFVPGIPSLIQIAYAGAIAAGLLALPTLLVWWRRLWPPELPAEYGNRIGYHLARATRGLAFSFVYLPLAAIPAFAASQTKWTASLIKSLIRQTPQTPA